MSKLRRIGGFLPYIAVVFLNAFVDLGHKIIVQNTIFKIYDGPEQIILTAIVNTLILLPFILLMTPSGFLSDKYPKNKVMKLSAVAAVCLTLLITLCYYQGWFWPAFAMTFLLAVQSAFYSPAKYGYIKELVGKSALGQGNGAVQAATIAAILGGTYVFSVFFDGYLEEQSFSTKGEILELIAPLGWVLVVLTVVEMIFAFNLPNKADTQNKQLFDWQGYVKTRSLKKTLRVIRKREVIWLSVIGLSLLWSIGQVLLAVFPAFAKEQMGIQQTQVIQGIIACAGVGIVFGSLIAGRLSRHYIETGLLPIGALGVAFCVAAMPTLTTVSGGLITLLLFGVASGFIVVPLNSLIQFHAGDNRVGSILAGNNWIQNVFMLTFLVATVLFSAIGLSPQIQFMIIAVISIVGAIGAMWKIPQSFARYIVRLLIGGRYKMRVQGLKNMPGRGGVLLLGNHISWIDWAMLQIASPRPIKFVMHRDFYERWYLKWFLELVGAIPIGGRATKSAMKKIEQLLNAGEVVCVFPEGVISRTGHLAEFQRGYETAIADTKSNTQIIPFYLRGLWGSRFSRSNEALSGNNKKKLKRDIIVAFGKPLSKDTKAEAVKAKVFELSIQSWDSYTKNLESLPEAWIDTVKSNGSAMATAELGSEPVSHVRLLTVAVAFSRRIKANSPETNVGILLPSVTGGAIANLAAMLVGKVVVNINYYASVEAQLGAIEKAEIKSIYTSRKFIVKLEQRGIDIQRVLDGSKVFYLEDLKENIGKLELLSTLIAVKLLPADILKVLFCVRKKVTEPAAILFSSGSEGAPKGVVLSHQNIIANAKQAAEVLNVDSDDVLMGCLPLFHAFGLTVGLFLPAVIGIPVVYHPDPTDAINVAKAIKRFNATIFCGTSTFLRLYTRNSLIHPLMLESLRMIVAGAEKLSPDVKQAFQLKFNRELFEGYGVTETAPVASVNIPNKMDPTDYSVQLGNKEGTVGMPLPGTSFRIVDPDTLEELAVGEEGLVVVGGSQVMLGYLNDLQKTNEVIYEQDGIRWYKTGDKGKLDEDGFLTIVDRYSRFAKLGGEMISLGAVEQTVRDVLADAELEVVAVNLPDEKKGEKVILLVGLDNNADQIRHKMIEHKISPLMIPAVVYEVDEVPKLGSGKTDFGTAKKLAVELASS